MVFIEIGVSNGIDFSNSFYWKKNIIEKYIV